MRKNVTRVFFVLAAALVITACGSVLTMIGKLTAGAMNTKVTDVSKLTAVIKLANYNHPRPLLKLEKDWLKDHGRADTEVTSHAFMMLATGMKFAEVEGGSVTLNGKPMDFMGNGVYVVSQPVEPGSTWAFTLKGKEGPEVAFTETYDGAKMEVTSPAPNGALDLGRGFELTWNPGPDPSKVVKVSLFIEQVGIQNVFPVAYFHDTGKAFVSPALLAEVNTTGQGFQMGANSLVVERQRDEIRYVMNEDSVVGFVDADVVPVTLVGTPAKPVQPVIDAIEVAKGDVTVKLDSAYAAKNMAPVADVKQFGISSFVLKGTTAGSESSTSSTTAGNVTTTTTTTTSWEADLGRDNLVTIANTLADRLGTGVAGALGATEVPAATLTATKGYGAMKKVASESSTQGFFVTARDLTSLDALRQLQIRIGGGLSWYYDMQRASGTQLLVECYVTLARHKPKGAKEFAFDVTVDLVAKSYPYPLVEPFTFPGAHATFKSTSFEWKDGMPVADVVKAIKVDQVIDAYVEGLGRYKAAQAALK